jgi:hypothetical protein
VSFTKEEFEAWHKAKREREFRAELTFESPPVAICIHCHRPFGMTEGVIMNELALCDICNGD